MKNILLYTRPIVPPWDEASKILAYEIARHHNSDHSLHVLSLKKGDFRVDNIHSKQVVTEKIFSKADLRMGLRAKMQLLKRLYSFPLNADIIHFLFTPRSLTSWLIRMRLKMGHIKSIQTVATVSEAVYQNKQLLEEVFFADVIVAQSYYTQQRLFQAGLKNVSLIYPGIDLSKYTAQPKDQALMRRLGIYDNDFVLLFPGEYTRLKAIDDIVEAFDIMCKKRADGTAEGQGAEKNYKLILACRIKSAADIRKKSAIVAKIRQLGYNDKVVFIDTFADMPKLYNLSDVVLFPVREMAGKFDIPLAVIEPMACQKPVVVSDIEVLQEFIKDGITGLVTPKGDPKSLADRIEIINRDPDLRRTLADNAAKFVSMTFDISQCVKRYEVLYDKL